MKQLILVITISFLMTFLFSTKTKAEVFFQGGASGVLEFRDNDYVTTLRPGAMGALGWKSKKYGVRGVFNYVDSIPIDTGNAWHDFYNVGLDFLYSPVSFRNDTLTPYLVVGGGYYIVDLGNSTSSNGLGGNIGLGLDYKLSETISIGVENLFRPIAFLIDDSGDFLVTYNFMGLLTFKF